MSREPVHRANMPSSRSASNLNKKTLTNEDELLLKDFLIKLAQGER